MNTIMQKTIVNCLALCMAIVCIASVSLADQSPAKGIIFPILYPKISSKFGIRKHPVLKYKAHHSGIDLAVPRNSHVRAVSEGTVVFADEYGGYGKLVTINHKDGFSSLYGHLNEITVNIGDKIMAGQVIGRVGETGRATGNHLHFEWRKNGVAINPLEVFPDLASRAQG